MTAPIRRAPSPVPPGPVLVAGGTGALGSRVVQLLASRGLLVRVLTRDPDRARHLRGDLVEVVAGDVRDPRAAERAVRGARVVVSTVHGFTGTGDDNPRTVDLEGNCNLIRAARAAGVERFVLLSIHSAAPDHPLELFRMKALAERELRASGLAWTIVRPTAYMETWAMVVGEPLIRTGRTRIFGRGENPINFVSVADVARVVDLAVVDPDLCGATIEVGGPQNLTFREFVRTIADVTGKRGAVSAVPLPMLRLMSVLMRRINPAVARQAGAAVVMDTTDMAFHPAETRRRFPGITPTTLAEVVRRDYVDVELPAHSPTEVAASPTR
jgi:uncharacterized protein YbjT (DUF2867 family)